MLRAAVARKLDIERHAAEDTLGDLRKPLRAGKPEIIKVQIVARYDNRNVAAAGLVVPRLAVHIEEAVGHRLEEEVGREADPAHADRTRHPVIGRGEGADAADKRLGCKLVQLPGGEVRAPHPERIERTDLFREDQEIALGEGVRGLEQRQHVAIGLHRGKYDGHADHAGQGEAEGLRETQVAAQEFPKQGHRRKI